MEGDKAMNNNNQEKSFTERVDEGVKAAIKAAIDEHIKEGRPYVISQDNKIVWV